MDSINNFRFYQELKLKDKVNVVRWHSEESPKAVSEVYQERTGCDDDERIIQERLFDGWTGKLYCGYFTGHLAKVALVVIGACLIAKKLKHTNS